MEIKARLELLVSLQDGKVNINEILHAAVVVVYLSPFSTDRFPVDQGFVVHVWK